MSSLVLGVAAAEVEAAAAAATAAAARHRHPQHQDVNDALICLSILYYCVQLRMRSWKFYVT